MFISQKKSKKIIIFFTFQCKKTRKISFAKYLFTKTFDPLKKMKNIKVSYVVNIIKD